MKAQNKVTILQSKQARVGFSTGAFLTLAQRILKQQAPELLKRNAVLEVVWVSDAQIKKLNREYRDKNEATDVLSFSYIDTLSKNQSSPDNPVFGQLIISVDTLKKQAKDHGHAYYKEAEILFVHGLLHILGFDHMQEKDFIEMMKMEQKYLGDKSGLVHRSTAE